MNEVKLANRIISAVYRKDGGKALDHIEEELDASLSTAPVLPAYDTEAAALVAALEAAL